MTTLPFLIVCFSVILLSMAGYVLTYVIEKLEKRIQELEDKLKGEGR